MQVDSAATCNTMPLDMYCKLAPLGELLPSKAKIKPYAGEVFSAMGRQTFSCEGADTYDLLDFEVIDSNLIPGKSALLSV